MNVTEGNEAVSHRGGGAALDIEPARSAALAVATAVRLKSAGAGAGKPSRLWLWFVAVFALQLGAWTTWFVIASQNKVAEVPLATSPVP